MNVWDRLVGLFRVRKSISALDNKLTRLKAKVDASREYSDTTLRRVDTLQRDLSTEVAKLRSALTVSEATVRQLEEALSGVRDELKTANEILIPGLVSANRVFMERWEAEARVIAIRSALVSPDKGE